jgi:hypothetical protein
MTTPRKPHSSNDIVRGGVIHRRCSRCDEYKPRNANFVLAGRNRGRLFDGNGDRHRKYTCKACDKEVRDTYRARVQPDMTRKERMRAMNSARDAALRRLAAVARPAYEYLYREELKKRGIDPDTVRLNKPHVRLGEYDPDMEEAS